MKANLPESVPRGGKRCRAGRVAAALGGGLLVAVAVLRKRAARCRTDTADTADTGDTSGTREDTAPRPTPTTRGLTAADVVSPPPPGVGPGGVPGELPMPPIDPEAPHHRA